MSEMMTFPETVEEFMEQYNSSAIFDAKELTAAAELINEYVNKNTPPFAYRSTQSGASLRNIIRLLANDIVEEWAREHPEGANDVRSTTSNHHK